MAGGESERFGNYLLQQYKGIHNLFAINQVKQLLLNKIKQFPALKSAHLCVCG